jgi:hypothetical protein
MYVCMYVCVYVCVYLCEYERRDLADTLGRAHARANNMRRGAHARANNMRRGAHARAVHCSAPIPDLSMGTQPVSMVCVYMCACMYE